MTVKEIKRVTIYFKSGNTIFLTCKDFKFTIINGKRNLEIKDSNLDGWFFDLMQIEAYTIQ
jgi:hypothetical protein